MTDMPEWRQWADGAHKDSLRQSAKHGKARFKCSNPRCGHKTSEGLAKKNGRKCFSCKSPLIAKVPLGANKVPQVGELWSSARGDLVAVVSQSTQVGGGFNAVILSLGESNSSWKPGSTYVTGLDGCVLPDKSSHPRDLKRFVKNF